MTVSYNVYQLTWVAWVGEIFVDLHESRNGDNRHVVMGDQYLFLTRGFSGLVAVQELLVSEISPGCWLPLFSTLGKTIMSLSRVH